MACRLLDRGAGDAEPDVAAARAIAEASPPERSVVAGPDAIASGPGARSSGAAGIGIPGRGAVVRVQRVLDHAGVLTADAAVSFRIVGSRIVRISRSGRLTVRATG